MKPAPFAQSASWVVINTAEEKSIVVENPPVVVSRGKISLADHLKLNELPLATTPGGKNFALKALHPSEHTIKSARVPGSNVPSVAVCWDSVNTVNITNANSVASISQTANPICPVVMSVKDGGTTTFYDFFNTVLTGEALVPGPSASQVRSIVGNVTKFEKYRVTSQSVTVELIAPQLADQGTITAAQFAVEPTTVQPTTVSGATSLVVFPDVWVYRPLPQPGMWLLGTSAYTSKAREGVYQPLKLDKFDWVSAYDVVSMFDDSVGRGNFQLNLTDRLEFPYMSNRTAVANQSDLDFIMRPSSDTVGVIQVAGIAATASLRIRIRQVVELTGTPDSFFAPMFEAPLPPDELSQKMYFEISARMADAYPASYNDLGKLRDIIYKVGKKVLPFAEPLLDVASGFGGPIGLLASAGKALLPTAQAGIAKEREKRKAQKKLKALPPPKAK